MNTQYQVVNIETKVIIKTYKFNNELEQDKARSLARKFANKEDLKLGGVKHIINLV